MLQSANGQAQGRLKISPYKDISFEQTWLSLDLRDNNQILAHAT